MKNNFFLLLLLFFFTDEIFVYGGCSVEKKTLNDLWSIQINDAQLSFRKVG